MLVELSLIKAFLTYSTWETHSPLLTSKDLPEELQFLYRVLDTFHQTNEEKVDLHLLDLANLFFSQTKKDKEFYQGVFDTLESYTPNLDTVKQLVVSLKRARLLREASIVAYEVAEGKKDYQAFQSLLDGFAEAPTEEEEEKDEFVTDELDDILNATYKQPGLTWPLKALNKSLGSLRKGDFGFIFARPEVGKTTWLAHVATHMAPQCEGPILWANNEEVSDKVKSRVFQSALACTTEQLLASTTICNTKYKNLIGNKILIPKHSITRKEDIERLCKQHRPSLIIIDTIDGITGFKADREDLVLGAIYKWARELAKEYGPVIGVCHADGTAEGQKWLTMTHVVNAKTEKQKHADWICGIGAIPDNGWERVRFLSISKNKLTGDPGVTQEQFRHGRMEVLINPPIARYEDIE